MSKGTCNVEGCELAVRGRGLCHVHYTRIRKYGDVLAELPKGALVGKAKLLRGPCIVESCGRLSSADGYCPGHRTRVRRHGHPQADVPLRVGRALCAAEGCERPRSSVEGWCQMHLKRVRHNGSVERERRPIVRDWVADELKRRPASDDCWTDWPWKSRLLGRPVVRVNGNAMTVARYVRFVVDGEFPIYACHTCDNEACWNPRHLYAGDAVTNAKDMAERGRWRNGAAAGQRALVAPSSQHAHNPRPATAGGCCVSGWCWR